MGTHQYWSDAKVSQYLSQTQNLVEITIVLLGYFIEKDKKCLSLYFFFQIFQKTFLRTFLIKKELVQDVDKDGVCEAQVALIHLGGHEIGYVILIQSRFRVGTVLCGDFGPRTWQGDGKIS